MFEDFDDNEPENDDFFNNTDIEESLQKFRQLEQEEAVFFSEDEIEALSYHFFLNNKHEEQLKIVEHGLYLYPNKVDFLIDKASVLSIHNKYADALDCILIAKDLEPYNPLIYKIEGEILCDLDKSEEAEIAFLNALAHSEFEDDEFIIELYTTYSQMLAQDKLIEKANGIIENALKRFENNETLFNQLAMNFITGHTFEAAIDYFKAHIDANPYSYLAWYHLGRFYELSDQSNLAFKAYEYSSLINKDSKNAFFSLGGLYESRGNYRLAMENYEACIKNEGDLYPYICIARCYLGLENGEMARIYLKKSENLKEVLPEYNYLIGYSYLTDKQALKALPFFKKVYKTDKNDFSAIKGILTCFAELERISDFETLYFEFRQENKELFIESWKELASLLYSSEMDDLLEDLLHLVRNAQVYEDDLNCVLNILKYNEAPSKANKDVIISRLIHNFDDTLESVKLFSHELFDEDEEFKQMIQIYQKETDEQ